MAKSTRQRSPPKTPSQRTTKGTRTVSPETEERLSDAQVALRCGECKTYRDAAEKFNVPYFTLQQRCRDEAAPKTKAHLAQLLLSPASEAILVDWIRFLSATGHPINKRTDSSPSKSWIRRFLGRHPELKLGRGSGLDPKRAKAFNYTTVQAHFQLLKDHMDMYQIPWENMYNMDEKGIQLGGGRRGSQQKFFFACADKSKYKLKSDDLQLVTIIEAVCTDGSSDIPPGFVFAGTTKCPEWFKWFSNIATSENGWTDDFVGFEWFKQGFVPTATARNTSGTPILLIYDGHGSHTTLAWIDYARENNIHLFCLPPHTTHRLQPLDVGIFGPLQHAWFIRCDEILEETGDAMELRDVVSEYMKARRAAFKSGTILKAWRKAGIRPINPDIFTETDYAPSYSSSTQMHIPESFPRKMPSVPDASSDDGIFDPSTAMPSDPFDEDYCAFNSEDENNCMSCSDSNTIQDEDMETVII